MRTIYHNVDLDEGRLRNSVDEVLAAEAIRLFRGDTYCHAFRFYRRVAGVWTDATIPATSSLALTIKKTDDRAASVSLADADASAWNIDSISGYAAGSAKQTCRVALTKTELLALFGTTVQSLALVLEISEVDVNGFESTLCQQPITMIGDLKRGAEGTPAPSSPTYYTAAEVVALLDARIKVSGGRRMVVNADGSYGSEQV